MRDDRGGHSGTAGHVIAGLVTTFLLIGGAFTVVGVAWGGALSVSITRAAVVGLVAGAIPAALSGVAIGRQRSPELRRLLTVAAAARWGAIAWPAAIIGGIVWLVRAII